VKRGRGVLAGSVLLPGLPTKVPPTRANQLQICEYRSLYVFETFGSAIRIRSYNLAVHITIGFSAVSAGMNYGIAGARGSGVLATDAQRSRTRRSSATLTGFEI
jgi:F0F1-type ATP synthase membrane subunit c/vacuolar-type H+-ATPase subunit K